MTSHHKKYLEKRRFDPEKLIRNWQLMGTGQRAESAWAWRIVSPICAPEGGVVGYTGRTISSTVQPRWRTTENEKIGVDPHCLLYGIDKVEGNGVVIVEGPSDVWRLGPGAVGLLGIDWKVEQAAILRHFERRFIMLDPERLALKKARELAQWLAPFPGQTEIITGLSSDPGDLDQGEADSIMKELLGRTITLRRS